MPVQYEDKEVKLEMFENPDGSIDKRLLQGGQTDLLKILKIMVLLF